MASIKEFTNKQGRKRWRVHVLVDGTMRHPECRTFEEACQRVYLEEAERLQGVTPQQFMTMADFTLRKMLWFYLGWQWGRVVGKGLAESTYRKIADCMAAIPDTLLDKRIVQVSEKDIRHHVSEYSWVWLRAAFNQLKQRGLLMMNPCPMRERKEKKDVTVPSAKDVQRLLMASNNPSIRMFVFLCAVCGLRTCEALALRRSDVEGRKIVIRQHLTDGGVRLGTKRSPGRTIKVPEQFFKLLEKIDSDFVYLVNDGKRQASPVNMASYRAHKLKPLYDGLALNFSNHALRHFAAATWIDEGRDIMEVQRLLGHKNVSMTLEHYGHLLKEPGEVNCRLEL